MGGHFQRCSCRAFVFGPDTAFRGRFRPLREAKNGLELQIAWEFRAMFSRITFLVVVLMLGPLAGAQSNRVTSEASNNTIIGPRNMPLQLGAEALMAGENAEGVRLTHQGLRIAHGNREEEAALSNLCAGYIKLRLFDQALKYCDLLLARNDAHWRGYNNRAVAYIMTEQWDKAKSDLENGEALRPGATTMKVARSMYMDAVHPVAPEIEIDDRQKQKERDERQLEDAQP